jgi:sterol desaturase/sphingolipid hydroxylase (fatty acid hydroxylase superfamily)
MALSSILWLLAPIVVPSLAVMAVLQLWAERRWAAQRPRPDEDRSNHKVWGVWLLAQVLGAPALGVVVTLVVNRCGGGWIALPGQGWGLVLGALVYLAAMDLGEFLFHRAQHAWPWLWAMHSLHHSDTSFDATTTVRHFWLDPFLKSVSVWLAVALLFKAPMPVLLIYAITSHYNYVIHANTRLDFGRWSWVLNAPGYHRLHHSASPEHFDVNFAALLPIWDVIGRTYRPARAGERPVTGLDTGRVARSWWDVAAWPVAGLVRRRSAPRVA